MTRPPEWESMTDFQQALYRLGYAAGCVGRYFFPKQPKPSPPIPEDERDLTRHAAVRRFACTLDGTEDIIGALRAVKHPPKERNLP